MAASWRERALDGDIERMDGVFRALADPSRRHLLDRLNDRNGQTLRELCEGLGMARQSVSKHLAVLESANLISTMRRGREVLHFLNPEPINAIADRWINQYDRARVHALADLKRALEAPSMGTEPTNTEFVYTTYINTTPQRLWLALTDPAFTSRYWGGLSLESQWTAGAAMVWRYPDGTATVDPANQVVLESEPDTKLSYTWHTLTPEWAKRCDVSDEVLRTLQGERRSKVTFHIEPDGDGSVKLTVAHGDLEPGGVLCTMISGGWPKVLASLKTLLETGDVLVGG
jgi:uncharacterized protein YndB with AHSA1/START domain/DNA-binding transcriptional ArsR family regulator